MKEIRAFKLMGGALITAISINVWSQTSDSAAASTPSSMAPISHTSAKTARKTNRALSRKVLLALSKGGITTTDINVIANGGAVVLKGAVLDAGLIDKAGDLAKGVSGVTDVKNDLTVLEVGGSNTAHSGWCNSRTISSISIISACVAPLLYAA
jgi:hyperosmotically inducible protein